MSAFSSIQKMMGMVQQIGPFLNMLNSFGAGFGAKPVSTADWRPNPNSRPGAQKRGKR